MTTAEVLKQIDRDREYLELAVWTCADVSPSRKHTVHIELDALARLVAWAKKGAML